MNIIDRRKFIKQSSITGAAMVTVGSMGSCSTQKAIPESQGVYMGGYSAAPLKTIKIAMLGVGYRGSGHAKQLSTLPGTEIVAVCDLYEDLTKKTADSCKDLGSASGQHQKITRYHGDENSWKKMLQEMKPDAVFISTNWANHAPMAIGAMKAGAHAFVEVPMALTIAEMWDIVNTSEETQRHCMMMENVNYGRDELMYLNMCRQGVIGELLHGEASYIHELRWQMEEQDRGTGSWRTPHYAHRNGNLYPTHGLGPVAQYMNLSRGEDNFKKLVSFSSPAKGRQKYASSHYESTHKWNQLDFKGGDINTSLVKTTLGRTIMIQWDETSPRPYSRLNLIQGTKGTLAGFPTRVALEGGFKEITKDHHRWVQGEHLEALYEVYDHPLYKRLNDATKNSGHGGMDGIMIYRIVECLKNGLPLDQNVYEGCFWSAVTPLSELSVAQDGMPQDFPDFTRGRWTSTDPLNIIS